MDKSHMKIRRCFALLSVFLFVIYGVNIGASASLRNRLKPSMGAPAFTVTLEPALTVLSGPIYVTNAHDGSQRLFVVEQSGVIKVVQPGSSTATVFLNITSRVLAGGEQGLLGLTFHPQFQTNRRFFVDYTRMGDGATVIAEYQASAANPNIADTTETVILTIPQPFANHNGGMVEFGPDGFLYIAMGDGGSGNDPGNRAQNINDLLGKILRIDIDHPNGPVPYSSPPSNPFFGATAGRDEIYALGMRNPFRFSFDRATGELYAGDVGQGVREEVDIIHVGENHGWRVFEGTLCTNLDPPLCSGSNFTFPITEYSHTPEMGGRCAIIGGYVYRGTLSTLPVGSYVYGDLCTGEIYLLQGGQQRVLLDPTLTLASFGEDEAGELYVVELANTIYRIKTQTGLGRLNTPGLYNPASSAFFLRNANSSGTGQVSFPYGPAGAGWTPLAGNWVGNGIDTIGLYNPAPSAFFLRSSNTGGSADLQFTYGPAGAGWIPLAGDWNGDGVDTPGLYNPATSTFFLRNTNSSGVADVSFAYGPAGAGWIPLAGDWDGDGVDTIGLYNPATSTFFLRNTNSAGVANLSFAYGPTGAGWTPLAGDWNGDGVDTIGLYNPATSTFFLRNTNSAGVANLTFAYGPGGAGWKPLVGDWDGL
jgi:glucose/arabinose dehydrogenase